MVLATRVVVLARVLLPLYLAIVFLIVFSPSGGATQVTGLVAWVVTRIDELHTANESAYVVLEILANVAMFVPFGVLVWLAFARPRWWLVVLFGFVTTATIELVQSTMPTRYSTVSDVVANTLGAATGVFLVRVLADRAVRSRE
jgi:glycopeptide antibiotics resistance protein